MPFNLKLIPSVVSNRLASISPGAPVGHPPAPVPTIAMVVGVEKSNSPLILLKVTVYVPAVVINILLPPCVPMPEGKEKTRGRAATQARAGGGETEKNPKQRRHGQNSRPGRRWRGGNCREKIRRTRQRLRALHREDGKIQYQFPGHARRTGCDRQNQVERESHA